MKTTLFYFRVPHHGRYSAYHRLVEYMPANVRKVAANWNLPPSIMSKVSGKQRGALFLAAEKYLHATTPKDALIHHIYAKDTVLDKRNITRAGPVVLTAHQPVAKLKEQYKQRKRHTYWEAAKRAEAIVIVETGREEDYKDYFNNPNVFYIPHGIDTQYFCPAKEITPPKKLRVLTVGSWMRDYDLWLRIANKCQEKKLELEFTVLTSPSNRQKLIPATEGWGNVSFPSNLTDAQLLSLYHDNDILFLPLQEATANNAILEAAACGLPIVASDFPGVRGYLPANAGNVFFSNQELDCAVDFLGQAAQHIDQLKLTGQLNRQYAIDALSWESVVEQYMNIYSKAYA